MKRKIAFGVGIVLIIIAAAVFVGSLPESQPEPAVYDDRDLIPNRVEIPAESNGYSLLLQAGQLLTVAGTEPVLAGGTNWNEADAREILTNNQAAMDVLHQALARPCIQVDDITNANEEFDYLRDWLHLAKLALTEARLTFNSGDEAKGFAQTMDVIRFGQHLEEADGVEIHRMSGVSIKRQGLWCIGEFADKTTLPATNLILISKQLEYFEASQDAIRQALKMEYKTRQTIFDDLARVDGTNNPFKTRFLYNAARTKLELAGQIHSTMQAMTNCYATGIRYIPVAQTNESFIRHLFHGNMIGSTLNEVTLYARSKTLELKCRENVTVRATRILLALRAFEMINHRPASSLQELVPDYLEAVPLDDFDGKPMRYSPTLKTVYSVGVGLIDSGGIESTNSSTGDIVFPYNF